MAKEFRSPSHHLTRRVTDPAKVIRCPAKVIRCPAKASRCQAMVIQNQAKVSVMDLYQAWVSVWDLEPDPLERQPHVVPSELPAHFAR